MLVSADGCAPVASHIFDRDSEYLDDDDVMSVKPSLIYDFVEHADDADGTWVSLDVDIVLASA